MIFLKVAPSPHSSLDRPLSSLSCLVHDPPPPPSPLLPPRSYTLRKVLGEVLKGDFVLMKAVQGDWIQIENYWPGEPDKSGKCEVDKSKQGWIMFQNSKVKAAAGQKFCCCTLSLRFLQWFYHLHAALTNYQIIQDKNK